jgi:hypothetical protein
MAEVIDMLRGEDGVFRPGKPKPKVKVVWTMDFAMGADWTVFTVTGAGGESANSRAYPGDPMGEYASRVLSSMLTEDLIREKAKFDRKRGKRK